jgi:hypothetical protein
VHHRLHHGFIIQWRLGEFGKLGTQRGDMCERW